MSDLKRLAAVPIFFIRAVQSSGLVVRDARDAAVFMPARRNAVRRAAHKAFLDAARAVRPFTDVSAVWRAMLVSPSIAYDTFGVSTLNQSVQLPGIIVEFMDLASEEFDAPATLLFAIHIRTDVGRESEATS